jgi:SAM-dependent methyltransferase
MENPPRNARTHEEACRRVAARFRERWLRSYVSSKLQSDPVFLGAFEILRESPEPILDVGCGVGLLAFYLRERGHTSAITGLDIDRRKIGKGRAVADENYERVILRHHDVTAGPIPFVGNVALFDLLHYLKQDAQQALLQTLSHCVPPGGVMLIRDAPRDGSARYRMTYAAEIFAQLLRWNVGAAFHFPDTASIDSAFGAEEWTCSQQPAWGRTPFNNRLFIYRRHARAAAPLAG